MYKTNFPIKCNTISSIDYKRPIQPQHDMRTSYYFGHRLIYDNDAKLEGPTRADMAMLPAKRSLLLSSKSEMKAVFPRQYAKPSPKIISQDVAKLNGIKSYDEAFLKFAPHPIKDHLTTYKMDYVKKQAAPDAVVHLHETGPRTKIKKADFDVSPDAPNCSKYLDMLATSYALDYIPYSEEKLDNLAARNGITFWSWNNIVKTDALKEIHPAYISTFAKSQNVIPPKNVAEIRTVPSVVKSIPHRGFVSETKSQYSHPEDFLKLNVHIQKPTNLIEQIRMVEPRTEYSMIGSRDRIQRYV